LLPARCSRKRVFSLIHTRDVLDDIFGEDVHLARVRSLANGVTGVLNATMVSVSACPCGKRACQTQRRVKYCRAAWCVCSGVPREGRRRSGRPEFRPSRSRSSAGFESSERGAIGPRQPVGRMLRGRLVVAEDGGQVLEGILAP
jgi:hypothetical protein